MKTSRRARIVLPLVSLVTVFALSARAEPNGPPPKGAAKPAAHAAPAHPGSDPGAGHAGSGPGAGHAGSGPGAGHVGTGPGGGHAAGAGPGAGHAGAGPGHGPQNAHIARGHVRARNFGGHAYHGRLAWEGGRWRHEMHNGRDGWWWDVGGAWYSIRSRWMVRRPMSPMSRSWTTLPTGRRSRTVCAAARSLRAASATAAGPCRKCRRRRHRRRVAGRSAHGPAERRDRRAAAGGVTGAIVGAQAASRPGYYLAQGTCYYRYPSGQYVPADPRACY